MRWYKNGCDTGIIVDGMLYRVRGDGVLVISEVTRGELIQSEDVEAVSVLVVGGEVVDSKVYSSDGVGNMMGYLGLGGREAYYEELYKRRPLCRYQRLGAEGGISYLQHVLVYKRGVWTTR